MIGERIGPWAEPRRDGEMAGESEIEIEGAARYFEYYGNQAETV